MGWGRKSLAEGSNGIGVTPDGKHLITADSEGMRLMILDLDEAFCRDVYVVIEAEELEALRSARDKALSLDRFIDPGEIDPVVFAGRCLYLMPESGPAHRPYLLLAQAMRARHKWALGRVVMSGHRHTVVLRPRDRLLVMDVLHDPGLVRSAAWLEAELHPIDASPEELQLAGTLIDSAAGAVDWRQYRDDTPDKLAALVEAKVAGRELVAPVDEPVEVINLLDALKRSVARARSDAGAPSLDSSAASAVGSVAPSGGRRQRRSA